MKKSIVYIGIALLAFGNVAIAANNETGITEKLVITKNKAVSPLCQAIAKGDLQTVKKMVEFGSDINQTSNGMTPLMYAARYNKVEIVKLLLANGAKSNVKDDKGFTALKHAELSNATETVEILKAHKA
ncbi:ankyrin repeat domain-containing protein [uncultured Flavobacterium sp.]|uniref:ankyrin repeat domain-containing protein n=1 Tax=uncultured Flavobacterium sp. TaxID=165435 RepID=UPI0025D56325|nr:ankyrin repeat domain-containing protein [uncultured Flavobacterium sp.]